jgi:hypothetical protein
MSGKDSAMTKTPEGMELHAPESLVTADELADFLTISAYEQLD